MDKLKAGITALFRYPIIPIFFAFLAVFTLADMLTPHKEISELENKKLPQAPKFTLSEVVENKWTINYGEYTRDQFIFRDNWIRTYSALETAQGKLEAGGVWLAADDYQIAKNSTWSEKQQDSLDLNTDAVAALAENHPGKVRAMIVPSPANILADKLRWNPQQTDENALMDTLFGKLRAAGATVTDLRPIYTQMEAADEQIYYRTDHHWTTDGGAWAAYEAFCEAAGRTAVLPEGRVDVPGFLGTNYSKTLYVGTKADTLTYYNLPNAMTIYRTENDGSISEEATGIMDAAKLDTRDKYAAFMHGNNGYSVIEGTGEGSILVIKDSYGNSFVPYLTANYAKVGVIDLRAWLSVNDTIAEGAYDEILVLYSFDSFSQDPYVYRMAK